MARKKHTTDREMLDTLRRYFRNRGVKCSEFARCFTRLSRLEEAESAIDLRTLHETN
jgi:hypothetical protein